MNAVKTGTVRKTTWPKSEPRLVIVSDNAIPRAGGVADYVHRLAAALASTLDVHVVTDVPREGHMDSCLPYLIHRFPPGRDVGTWYGDSVYPVRKLNSAIYRMFRARHSCKPREMIEQLAPDIILSGCFSPWSLTLTHGRYRGLPKRGTCIHGLDLCTSACSVHWDEERVWLRDSDFIFVNSSYTAARAVEHGAHADRVLVVPPTVDVALWDSIDVTGALTDEWEKRLAGRRIVVSVGRLVRRKGFDTLLRAMCLVKQRVPDLLCVIVGDGPERTNLESLAEMLGLRNSVLFTGFVAENAKKRILELSSVMALLSRVENDVDFEGFGIVFLEAGLCGLPVVAGNSGGIPDAVCDGVTGFLVDPLDAAAAADRLGTLLTATDMHRSIGKAGRKHAESFDGKRQAVRVISYLKSHSMIC